MRHRSGRRPDLVSSRQVAGLPGLRLRGLLSHAGHAYHAASEDQLSAIAKEEAGTPRGSARRAARSWSVLNRRDLGRRDADAAIQRGPERRHRAAARQLRVLRSHAGRARRGLARRLRADGARHRGVEAAGDRIILDCGSKTLTSDHAAASRPGRATARSSPASGALDTRADRRALTIERLSEEHATVRVAGHDPLEPGDRVRVVPNHSCVVVESGRRGAAGRRRSRSSRRCRWRRAGEST